jgi:hypothetical protein
MDLSVLKRSSFEIGRPLDICALETPPAKKQMMAKASVIRLVFVEVKVVFYPSYLQAKPKGKVAPG